MSDPEEKTVNVIIKKETDEEVEKEVDVYSKAEKYNQLITEMRESLNEKWDTDVFNSIENDDEMLAMDKLLSEQHGQKTKKPSSGVVQMHRTPFGDEEEFDETEEGRRR